MSEAVTTRRAKRRSSGRRKSVGWLLALGVSALVHLGILVAFVVYGRSGEPVEMAEGPQVAPRSALLLVPIAVPVEVTEIEVTELPAADAPPPLARPWDAPSGERDNPSRSPAPRLTVTAAIARRPRPTAGSLAGRRLTAPFGSIARRCARGSPTAPPRLSRRGCGSRAAAPRPRPFAVSRRWESAIRSGPPRRAVRRSRRRMPPPIPALGGEPAGAALAAAPSAPSDAPPLVARADPNPNARHAVGPLDAEAGPRAFDTEQSGRAADDRTARTASDELHPGIIDFSRASAPRPIALADGRGPSGSPGAVSRPAVGVAPNELGARHPRDSGPDVDERTLDRRYQHYVQEINLRVQRVLEFPQRLKVRLEQGESIVTFAIDANGRLGEGPRVVKSSGFEEFDAAAVRAVRRSAPFPPLPDSGGVRPFVVSLRVKFDNPVVR